MSKIKKLPKWFTGEVYKEGETVTNRFTGVEFELNNIELSMYDFVMGASIMLEMGMNNAFTAKDLKKGLDWFRKNNSKAYKVLLD